MRYNVETMELRRGNQTLTITQEFIEGVACYIDRVDGRDCVTTGDTDRSAPAMGAGSAFRNRSVF